MEINCRHFKYLELVLLTFYAVAFYVILIRRSLHLSHEYLVWHGSATPRNFVQGWLWGRPNDLTDSQWRNFRGNLPILTVVMGVFTFVANTLRSSFQLKGRGMSIVWLIISLSYLAYLHGACILFILSIASGNFILVKIFAYSKLFPCILWIYNLSFLICNRIYEGYSFSSIGQNWAILDSYRGTFRWHICYNLVVLRMISFGCDYHWVYRASRIDHKKHTQNCSTCSLGKACYHLLQEKSVPMERFSFVTYLCYLIYAPLYIAGPIASFNAFSSQLDLPQKTHSVKNIICYGVRWVLNLLLMELMTHLFYYNALATSGFWRHSSAFETFVIGYGVLNFMWLKFLLIWRYFRFWALMGGVEAPENMPRCINNCYSLEDFWKGWHSSFNKWLVRYIYIPLGGARRKLLIVWVVFTFVAIWHDLEWKLLSWAWLTCFLWVPEILVKLAMTNIQAKGMFSQLILRELSAMIGAFTITGLMITNLVGYVIGPAGLDWLKSRMLKPDGLPVLGSIYFTFYVGTKIMFHIREAKRKSPNGLIGSERKRNVM
ncbi:hypothetical protein AMTRI_Chr01g112970 [Amborella trichopoda]